MMFLTHGYLIIMLIAIFNLKIKYKYKICSKTIMDTSDPNIIFNEHGESDYYTNYKNVIEPNGKRILKMKIKFMI